MYVSLCMRTYMPPRTLSFSLSCLAVTINHNSVSFLFASAEKSLDGLKSSFEEADGTKGVVFYREKSFCLSTRYDASNEGIQSKTLPTYKYKFPNTNLVININIHNR